MKEKRTHSTKQQPAHVIQCGDVIAAIHFRQSNCGLQYYDFVLTRTWKSLASGKQARAATFFAANHSDLIQAITKASSWINEQRECENADTNNLQSPEPREGQRSLSPPT